MHIDLRLFSSPLSSLVLTVRPGPPTPTTAAPPVPLLWSLTAHQVQRPSGWASGHQAITTAQTRDGPARATQCLEPQGFPHTAH